jgi:hypothetical protein
MRHIVSIFKFTNGSWQINHRQGHLHGIETAQRVNGPRRKKKRNLTSGTPFSMDADAASVVTDLKAPTAAAGERMARAARSDGAAALVVLSARENMMCWVVDGEEG